MAAPAKQSYRDFNQAHTFTFDMDGVSFLCAKPSTAQLIARGILPPALLLSQLDKGGDHRMNGDRHRVLLDEKAQDALLDLTLIRPTIFDGEFDECPDGMIHRRALNAVRDQLVIAILSQVYDTEVVRGATFRGGEGDGAVDREVVTAVRQATDGSAEPASRRVRGRNRPDARSR